MNKEQHSLRRLAESRYGVAVLCLALACLAFPEKGTGTYAVVTVDVCWTCGDDFQGRWNGRDYGVPLIVEKLEAHGFKGTFFVSPYCPPGLKEKMFENLRFLLSRGHDVQLHTHPDVFDPSRKNLNLYTKDEKREILAVGVRNLEKVGAPRPIAHRAGQLGIDKETLEVLPEFGIQIDSSIYGQIDCCKVSLPEELANCFVKVGGLYQLPIFLIGQLPYVGATGATAFQLDSTIWLQQKAALEQVVEQELPLVTIFMHFFSLYEKVPAAQRFEPLQVLGPNHDNIDAFDNILNLLQMDTRFKVVTVKELWEIHTGDPIALKGPSFLPYPGLYPTYVKWWRNSFSGGIKNIVFVLSPFLSLAAIGILVIVWRRRRVSSLKKGPETCGAQSK